MRNLIEDLLDFIHFGETTAWHEVIAFFVNLCRFFRGADYISYYILLYSFDNCYIYGNIVNKYISVGSKFSFVITSSI